MGGLIRGACPDPPRCLYKLHIDPKNTFWLFRLHVEACRIFRFHPAPGAAPVELGSFPFGWKYGPYFCQTAFARVLRGVPLDVVLLVHDLDDLAGFLLVFTGPKGS